MAQRVLSCSYSVLNTWSRGDYQDALNSLFHLEKKVTPQIVAGQEFDKAWTEETNKTKCQPEVFGKIKLNNPKTQLILTAKLNDWLTLKGKLDLYDEGEITDWKTGASDAQSVIRGHQGGVYAILAHYNKLPAKKFHIYHWNQYLQQPTHAFVWINDKYIQRTANWIETNASSLYDYIDKNDLWSLDKRRKS